MCKSAQILIVKCFELKILDQFVKTYTSMYRHIIYMHMSLYFVSLIQILQNVPCNIYKSQTIIKKPFKLFS